MERPLVIKGGSILSLHVGNDSSIADVLVKDGRIAEIAPEVKVPDDALEIDARGAIVMPGFVDAHRHLWQTNIRAVAADWSVAEYVTNIRLGYALCYEPDDVYIAMLAGAVEAIDAGVTTIGDFTHIMLSPDHADAALQALQDAGMRAVLYYGCYDIPVEQPVFGTHAERHADARRLRRASFGRGDGLVTMGLALTETSIAGLDTTRAEIGLAREIGLPMQLHMGTLSGRHGVRELHDAGLLGPDMLHVHCTFTGDDELKLIADTGGHVCATAETEMQMAMGFPMLARALRVGLRPSVGVDIVSDCSGDMFTQIRLGLQTARALDNQTCLDKGYAPPTIAIDSGTGLRFGTTFAAECLGLQDDIGTLAPGKVADIVVLHSSGLNFSPLSDPAKIVALHAHPGNVRDVIVGGAVLKRNGALQGYAVDDIRNRLEGSYRRVSERLKTRRPRVSPTQARYAQIVVDSTRQNN